MTAPPPAPPPAPHPAPATSTSPSGGSAVAVEAFDPYTGQFDEVWASDEYVTSELYKVTNGLVEKRVLQCEGDGACDRLTRRELAPRRGLLS